MKIGLLTIHHTYNYGAMLQAFATFKALENLGCQVEFIDFDNKTFEEERRLFLRFNSFSNILRNIRTLVSLRCQIIRRRCFERFYSNMIASPNHYNTAKDWDVSNYDIIITGSDQTFCLYLTNNPEEMRPFFLEHIKNKKKASYASSMGEKFYKLTDSDKEWQKKCFADFSQLSVREKKSADYIESLLGVRPRIVLDPVFLLSASDWDSVSKPTKYANGEYIAFYTVLSEPWVISFVEQVSSLTGLKVIALHPRTRFEMGSHFKYIPDNGPGEFVSIIKNAKYVVTTSFHATVFSIIYNKNFAALNVGEGNRLRSLIEVLELKDRLFTKNNANPQSLVELEPIFDNSNKLLQEEIMKSIDFLKNVIS